MKAQINNSEPSDEEFKCKRNENLITDPLMGRKDASVFSKYSNKTSESSKNFIIQVSPLEPAILKAVTAMDHSVEENHFSPKTMQSFSIDSSPRLRSSNEGSQSNDSGSKDKVTNTAHEYPTRLKKLTQASPHQATVNAEFRNTDIGALLAGHKMAVGHLMMQGQDVDDRIRGQDVDRMQDSFKTGLDRMQDRTPSLAVSPGKESPPCPSRDSGLPPSPRARSEY